MTANPAWVGWPKVDQSGCFQCMHAPSPNQLALFDMPDDAEVPIGEVLDDSSALVARRYPSWPRVETSTCGRPGFWRPRTPAIFGVRKGVGPLLLFPDTTILISLHEKLEEAGAFTIRALWSDHTDPDEAVRDLVQLWWWRDVRFLVSRTHLIDARKGMTPDRVLARRAAVRELEQDFVDRGGYEPILNEDVVIEDRPCALHSVPVESAVADSVKPVGEPPLPRRGRDKQLVFDALNAGCHVFVTSDKKILRCHRWFLVLGLAILSPGQLLEELDQSGELDDCDSPLSAPAPDLSALARFYGAFAKDCFQEPGSGQQ